MRSKILPFCIFLSFLPLSKAADVRVEIDPAKVSAWRVSPQIFGSYQEEHWGDISPGIFEQYIVNPSFESWYEPPGKGETGKAESKTRLVFTPLPVKGIAYPWEVLGESKTATFSFSKDCINSEQAQEIKVDGGTAGIRQTLALPDYRAKKYKLRIWVRAEGEVKVKAFFLDGMSGGRRLRESERTLTATSEWKPVTVTLDLGDELSRRHLDKFGIARLSLEVSGTGRVWFDQATLYPADAVSGLYNPETLRNLSQIRPVAIRWPGGNYTSGYHWRDGIGPVDKRPSRPNIAWGGTEPNHVGTDEWLRFCKGMKIEPVMGVGFGEITAGEAADWVEYCNGGADTPMGKLRAQNGHPAPYNVKYWGVGNEVYGSYQIGHADATTYARGLLKMIEAMKACDPSIIIIASANGVHNNERRQNPDWNDTVLKIAGHAINLMDAHYYVYGPKASQIQPDKIPIMQRGLLGASAKVEKYYKDLREVIARRQPGRDIGLVHYEWGVLPSARTGLDRSTFLNALATSSLFHAFIKNGDLVRGAMLHNFSFYVNPVKAHSEPPNPRTAVFQLYRNIAAGSRVVPVTTQGPVYKVSDGFVDIGRLENIPEIDALALLDDEGTLHVCLLNRSLSRPFTVEIKCAGMPAGNTSCTVQSFTSLAPAAVYKWNTAPVMQTSNADVSVTNGVAIFSIPAVSLHHVIIKTK